MIPLAVLMVVLPVAEQSAMSVRVAREASSHYCGIHCVYGAAKAMGVQAEFEDLVDEAYVSSKKGSTAEDLLAAFRHLNLSAKTTGFMTIDQLKVTSNPVILHVRAPCAGKRYSHWMLYLGMDEQGRLKIYDPPRDTGYITAAELMSMWDGVAIVAGETKGLRMPGLMSSSNLAAISMIGGLFFVIPRRWSSVSKIVSASLVCAAFVHLGFSHGLLRSTSATENIELTFFEGENQRVNVIDEQTTRDWIQSKDCVVVDARMRSAYARFHLPGAVNVPIDSGFLRFHREAQRIDPSKKVVVYCQSEHCGWADKVAGQLRVRGIQDIHIYRGGVNQWQTQGN